MKTASIIILLIAVGSGVFGWWGSSTTAGRKQYDEMAGMIPYFAMIAAGVLALVGVILLVIAMNRPVTTDVSIATCCQNCGYDLRATASPTCPECGETRDLGQTSW